jgi:nucleotide-binding universal stress UspA family protein
MIAPKQILVATDFGPASAAALRYGREFARVFDARLHALHVIGDIVAGDSLPPTYVQEVSKAQSVMQAGAREELHAFVTREEEPALGRDVTEVVATSNGVAPAILAYAEEHAIDLIIIGHHGHGGLTHFFLGSVAEKVVRGAPCPVLTVRHPEREFIQPSALEASLHA